MIGMIGEIPRDLSQAPAPLLDGLIEHETQMAAAANYLLDEPHASIGDLSAVLGETNHGKVILGCYGVDYELSPVLFPPADVKPEEPLNFLVTSVKLADGVSASALSSGSVIAVEGTSITNTGATLCHNDFVKKGFLVIRTPITCIPGQEQAFVREYGRAIRFLNLPNQQSVTKLVTVAGTGIIKYWPANSVAERIMSLTVADNDNETVELLAKTTKPKARN
jgi:hypothetical protein